MARASWLHVYAAVAYADIFSYPLTHEEIVRWSRWPKNRSIERVALPSILLRKQQWYVMRGKSAHIARRARRFSYSKQKWRIARQVSWWLRWIPTIELVGVTGGLAMNNAEHRDDIDIFIVTTHGCIWITRFLSVLVVSLLGKRRTPFATQLGNTICMNMFVSKQTVATPVSERDLFAAHEVLQMVPLWERRDTYRIFLRKNIWVKKFLPNAWDEKAQVYQPEVVKVNKHFLVISLWHVPFFLLEQCARIIQLLYMRHRRTSEVITDDVLRFHPRDARVWVKEALAKRLKRVDIPLDKIFYAR